MKDLRVALWTQNLTYPVASMADWVQLVDSKAAQAAADNADVLILPEYSSLHWLSFLPAGLKDPDHLPWMAAQSAAALKSMQNVAQSHQIHILVGTFPVEAQKPWAKTACFQPNDKRQNTETARFYNRAFMVHKDGAVAFQDKICLTPWELDEDIWNVQAAETIQTFNIEGVRCAVLVCLDVEQPMLAKYLIESGADCLFVPSMTSLPSGYHRVFACARARAIEAMMPVAVVGAIGIPARLKGRETNYSGAAVYTPAEMDIQPNGIQCDITPNYGEADGQGPLTIQTLPILACAQKRKTQPEAWPGLVIQA